MSEITKRIIQLTSKQLQKSPRLLFAAYEF